MDDGGPQAAATSFDSGPSCLQPVFCDVITLMKHSKEIDGSVIEPFNLASLSLRCTNTNQRKPTIANGSLPGTKPIHSMNLRMKAQEPIIVRLEAEEKEPRQVKSCAGKCISPPSPGDTVQLEFWIGEEVEDHIDQIYPTAREALITFTLSQTCGDEILSSSKRYATALRCIKLIKRELYNHMLIKEAGGLEVGEEAGFECSPAKHWLDR
ncbi:hypothetical protein LTR49_026272 [Elasticomyces elasticus]|nr:hypothetical protein LTR49_026272 [Elasticomyces elasticus]